MSEWGSILEVVESELRVAMPDLPAGELGFERADGMGESLTSEKLPHVYVRDLVEGVDEPDVDYGVEDVTILLTMALWTRDESQEAVSVRLDALRDQLRANRTLGGIVDKVNVVARQIEEFMDNKHRRAQFIVQVEVRR